MVADLIRDSAFGHIVRLVSGNKLFQYPEEHDPTLANRYYNVEKTRNIARYGQVTRPDDADDDDNEKKRHPSDSEEASRMPSGAQTPMNGAANDTDSAMTTVPLEAQVSNVVGAKVDPEKGRDLTVVDWDGPDDPEVIRLLFL